MRLTRNQIEHYKYEIRRNTGLSAIIHENGIFEIFDIDETSKNRVVNQLRNLDFIQTTNVGSQKYDFGSWDFSKGYAQPKQKFTIRGLVKEEENLEEDVMEEAFTAQKCCDWIMHYRNENVARMSEQTLIDYANGLANWYHYQSDQVKTNYTRRIAQLLNILYETSDQKHYRRAHSEIAAALNRYLNDADRLSGATRNIQPQAEVSKPAVNRLKFGESVEIHDELNPAIWTENKELKPEVEDKIEDIVDTFIEILKEKDIDIKVEDIYLLGSNANYNYNESSDIDIHIIADEESFNCNKDHLPIIYDCMKTLFNKKYDISIYGINVELYVESAKQLSNVATGIYSLNDGWIKDPSKYQIPEIDNEKINYEVTKWQNRYHQILANPTYDAIEDFIDDLYDLRVSSIQEDGEFGEGNLVFKEVRRVGILDELKDLKDEIESRELSLESLQEKLILESSETNLYQYDGPVYGYNDEELGYFKDFVLARSEKEALNRINYKIKLKLHMDLKKSVIYLEPGCLNLVEVDYEDDAVVSHEKCSECGQLLNAVGECSICDLGDNTLDEEVHRQTLLKDLKYTTIDEFLNGHEIITQLSKLDKEKYLQTFSDAGFINDLDEIIIPQNTQLTYKTSKEYNGNTYDIFYVKGNPKCLIAVNVRDIVDLFGESLKKNKEDKKKISKSKLKFGN